MVGQSFLSLALIPSQVRQAPKLLLASPSRTHVPLLRVLVFTNPCAQPTAPAKFLRETLVGVTVNCWDLDPTPTPVWRLALKKAVAQLPVWFSYKVLRS